MSKAKPIFTLFLGLYLIILLINLIFPLSSFAQSNNTTEEETLTIATYYPAPYGIYNEMRAKKMAVGDNYLMLAIIKTEPKIIRVAESMADNSARFA